MNTGLSIMVFGGGVLLIGGSIHYYLAARQTDTIKDPLTLDEKEHLELSSVSDLWTAQTLSLASAATIWCSETEQGGTEQELAVPVFHHEEIEAFFREKIVPKASVISTARKAAIVAILKLLDKEGECSSVVRNQRHPDAENKYDDNAFAYLSQIPLWRHTLSVTEEIMRRASQDVLLGDLIIVALGHDIGKIPAYHDKGYMTGDHPVLSAIALGGLSEYAELRNRKELDAIIKSHHALAPANTLAVALKEADGSVREEELAHQFRTAVKQDQLQKEIDAQNQQKELADEVKRKEELREVSKAYGVEPPPHVAVGQANTGNTQQKNAVPVAPGQGNSSHSTLPQQEPDPKDRRDFPIPGIVSHGEPGIKAKKPDLQFLDVSWVDCEKVLAEIRSWVNRTSSDGRWGVVSMPDGLVYVTQDALYGILKSKAAPQDKIAMLQAWEADEQKRRNILYSVVWRLIDQKAAVDTALLRPGYYLIPCQVTGAGRMPAQLLLIPFKAEALGALPSELEALKTPHFRTLVKSIRPKIGVLKQESQHA